MRLYSYQSINDISAKTSLRTSSQISFSLIPFPFQGFNLFNGKNPGPLVLKNISSTLTGGTGTGTSGATGVARLDYVQEVKRKNRIWMR